MKTKKLCNVNFSEFDLASIKMISDYLFLDRFNDSSSFVRFEQCFGPLFSSKNKEFKLVEAFREIVGPKRKYLTFRRLIKAFIRWKQKASNNYSFNFFMSSVFDKMIKKKGEVIGELVEGQRVFSTKNCKNRKIITKFSVLTDEEKNKIKGFVITYDEVFKAILCKQEKKEDIHMEINFDLFHSQGDQIARGFQLDRDGISHIAGKYNETTKNIKLLIFKCRSGKTLYIGDSREADTDKIVPFIFGSSICQLKTMYIELINDTLAYIQPKYQLSTRKNENLEVNFDDVNEQFLENDPLKFEEGNYEKASEEDLKDDKKFLMPMVPDDQFVDKMSLVESNYGKHFKDIYRSLFEEDGKKPIERLKDSIRKVIDDTKFREKREEKVKNELSKIVLRDSYYMKKENFDSVLVNVIKMKEKLKESMNQGNEVKEDFIEEDDDDEIDLRLQKIESGVYIVKGQNAPLRAQPKKTEVPEEKAPMDSVKNKNIKKKEDEPKDGPKDSVKK
jgi:hypothetical protein